MCVETIRASASVTVIYQPDLIDSYAKKWSAPATGWSQLACGLTYILPREAA
jgi:hypothetical protein